MAKYLVLIDVYVEASSEDEAVAIVRSTDIGELGAIPAVPYVYVHEEAELLQERDHYGNQQAPEDQPF